MSDIRIAELTTTTTTTADDDYLPLDGSTNGTRKILASNLLAGAEAEIAALDTRLDTAEGNITDLTSNLASTYDSTAAYDVGEYCLYDGLLYVCSAAVETAGDFDSDYWTAVTVGEELTALQTDLDASTDFIFCAVDELTFAEDKFIAVSSGKYLSNTSYPYLYGENQYRPVSKSNPAMVTMNNSDYHFRVHLYSANSQSNFIETIPWTDGDEYLILNGDYNGTAYAYVRFTIARTDSTYSTDIFDTLVDAFQFRRRSRNAVLEHRTEEEIHFDVTINSTYLINQTADSETSLTVDSVLILPESYTPDGEPTKAVFIHHGQSGLVRSDSWYTEVSGWSNVYTPLLDAGFAVFDVNGSGPAPESTDDNDTDPYATYHRDYGCPNALQAAFKAYEYITTNYNIDPRIYVSGYSMGGATGLAFAKKYPNIVRAVGLLSPAILHKSVVNTTYNEYIATNYGYDSVSDMASDGYTEVSFSSPEIQHYDSDGNRVFYDFDTDWSTVTSETHYAYSEVPLKIWHGDSDTTVDPTYNEALVDSLRNNGCMAYFMPITSGTHTLSTLTAAFDEIPLWFARF